jgi:hypothetical protein
MSITDGVIVFERYIDYSDNNQTLINIKRHLTNTIDDFNSQVTSCKEEFEFISQRNTYQPLHLKKFIEYASNNTLENTNDIIPSVSPKEDKKNFITIKGNFIRTLHEYYINEYLKITEYLKILEGTLFSFPNPSYYTYSIRYCLSTISEINCYVPKYDQLEKYTEYTNYYIASINKILEIFDHLYDMDMQTTYQIDYAKENTRNIRKK